MRHVNDIMGVSHITSTNITGMPLMEVYTNFIGQYWSCMLSYMLDKLIHVYNMYTTIYQFMNLYLFVSL